MNDKQKYGTGGTIVGATIGVLGTILWNKIMKARKARKAAATEQPAEPAKPEEQPEQPKPAEAGAEA